MIIETQNFRKFQKFIFHGYSKGYKEREYLYLDFENEKAYIVGDSYYADLKFGIKEKNTNIKNMYVEISTFLALCHQYDTLDINEDYKFLVEKDEFKIPYYHDSFEKIDIDYDDLTNSNSIITYRINSRFIETMKKAINYMGPYDLYANYYAVQIYNERIISTNAYNLFQSILDSNTKIKCNINGSISKILSSMPFDDGSMGYDNEKAIIFFNFDNILRFAVPDDNVKIPDVKKSKFIEKYDHDNFITVEKESLVDVLEFFEPFVSQVTNQPLCLEILPNNYLKISSEGEKLGHRLINLSKNDGDNENTPFWVIRSLALSAVRDIVDDFVTIQLNANSPAINITGDTEKTTNIVLVRIA